MFSRQDMSVSPIPWWGSTLFWRTFFLIGFLLVISIGSWMYSFRLEFQGSRTRTISEQVASMVTITRAALVHSEPDSRRELLLDLAKNEGIRIYPLEPTDRVVPISGGDELMQNLYPYLQQKMGSDTVVSPNVNDMPGFWISFKIDEDDVYWLRLDNGRVRDISSLRWLTVGGVVLVLALLGAGFVSTFLNKPLARLAYAARQMASGTSPQPLPEKGVTEIKVANQSFNQMVSDLARVDKDRTEILAGISHDLRTPLTRMRLELEMSSLPEESLDGLKSDISQIDAIVGQFLDYARLDAPFTLEVVDVSSLARTVAADSSRQEKLRLNASIEDDLTILATQTDIMRLVGNILSNAQRYGQTPNTGVAEVDMRCARDGNEVAIEFSDHGTGVPDDELERMLRPFTRLDTARGQAGGSGLGLAIVSRIVKRYHGRISLGNRKGGGLSVTVLFPRATRR